MKKLIKNSLVGLTIGTNSLLGTNAKSEFIKEPTYLSLSQQPLQQALSPMEFYHEFRSDDGCRGIQYVYDSIFNYSSSNVDENLIWQETFNPYMASYSINLPRTQTFFPGENTITTTFLCSTTGANIYGNVDVSNDSGYLGYAPIPEPNTAIILGTEVLILGGYLLRMSQKAKV